METVLGFISSVARQTELLQIPALTFESPCHSCIHYGGQGGPCAVASH